MHRRHRSLEKDIDNSQGAANCRLPARAALTASWKSNLLGGVMAINMIATKIGSTTNYPFLAIRIHRNHPSVIIWSMSNEVKVVDGSVADKAKALLKRMITVTHTENFIRSAAEGIVIANLKTAKKE